jgi:outer membrane lipoprotein-sorting protein
MQDWQVMYGKDTATGRDYAVVTFSNPSQGQSWRLEIDLETNLPVRAKGWHNIRREGAPSMNFQKITFSERLSDDIFEFEIPEGATVIRE